MMPEAATSGLACALLQTAADPSLTRDLAALLRDAGDAIVDLAQRLARREDANLIMREHLALLSEALSQARASSAIS